MLSLHFLFKISVIILTELFLRVGGGGNSLKQRILRRVHVKRAGTNKGVQGWG